MSKGVNFRTKQEGADVINGSSTSVNLYTDGGAFVANVPMLPFLIPPQVIVWGERVFTLMGYFKPGNETGRQYREAFCYIIPPNAVFPEAELKAGLPLNKPLLHCLTCGGELGNHLTGCPDTEIILDAIGDKPQIITDDKQTCPNCHIKTLKSSKYCPKCGVMLNKPYDR